MIHIVFHSLLSRVKRFTNKWTILDVYNANLEKGIQYVNWMIFFLFFFSYHHHNHNHNHNLHLEINHTSQVLEEKFWKEIKSRVLRMLLYFGCLIYQTHIKQKSLFVRLFVTYRQL